MPCPNGAADVEDGDFHAGEAGGAAIQDRDAPGQVKL